MFDTAGVEGRGTALDPVHGVTLLQQELGKVSAILTGDPGNQRCFVRLGTYLLLPTILHRHYPLLPTRMPPALPIGQCHQYRL
jgi:hypothetical protein